MIESTFLQHMDTKTYKEQLKAQYRKQKEDNIRYTNNMYEQLSNELYQKAISFLKNDNNIDKQRVLKAFRETEIEVEKAAMSHSIRYCLKQQLNVEEFSKPFSLVYKLLLLPEGALKKYVQSQQKIILKNEYKQYARVIHPDKNSHPHSCLAFQKLRKFWIDIPKASIIGDSSSTKP